MKKFWVFIVFTITVTFSYGQKSIDNLFDRYAGKDGFTTVTINGNLLKWARHLADNDEEIPFRLISQKYAFLRRKIKVYLLRISIIW